MTMLEQPVTVLDQRYKTPSMSSEQGVSAELSEADIFRRWVAHFHENQMHPDVQKHLTEIVDVPWKTASEEDTIWAVGQAAMGWAKLGELPPPVETPLVSTEAALTK